MSPRLLFVVLPLALAAACSATRTPTVAEENARPGSDGWKLTRPAGARLGAYSDAMSFAPGDEVPVRVAAEHATTAAYTVWRLGHYAGAGGRLILSGSDVRVPQARAPHLEPATGAVYAGWDVVFRITLPDDLASGTYVVRIDAAGIGQTYLRFIVREPTPRAPLVLPTDDHTMQAYNLWGGTSLYASTRLTDWGDEQAFAASYDRPTLQNDGLGIDWPFDAPLFDFLESQGLDIAYISDVDFDADPGLLRGRKAILLPAHGEYWTNAMRDHAERAVAAGVSLLHFGADSASWRVRLEPSLVDHAPRRTVVGYKEFASKDPRRDPSQITDSFRNVGRPENALFGNMFGNEPWFPAPLVVANGDHWIWTGGGARTGDLIANVVADETDARFENGAEPPGVEEIGHSFVSERDDTPGRQATTLYTAPSGAIVFSAGDIGWGKTLTISRLWDARTQAATANLVHKVLGEALTGARPLALPIGQLPPMLRPGVKTSTVTAALPARPTAIAALPTGGVVVAAGSRLYAVTPDGQVALLAGSTNGDVDGPVQAAKMQRPEGVTVAPDGAIYIADTGSSKIRVLRDGMVTTVAGSTPGFSDGAGAAARLKAPLDVVALPSGVVLIADTGNNRIRALSVDGNLSTIAGTGVSGSVDGPGATATISAPVALALMPDGGVAFAEAESGVIRRIAPDAAHTVTTLVGMVGELGSNDGMLPGAAVQNIIAMAARPTGELLLVDAGAWRLRIAEPTQVRTLVNGGAAALDGPSPLATLASPRGVAVVSDGSVWVADGDKSIRRVTIE